MSKTGTVSDLGTAFVIYQAVLEILSEETKNRLEDGAKERFKKFAARSTEIDAAVVASSSEVEQNCEKFCYMALNGIFDMLEAHFPVEDTSENVSE